MINLETDKRNIGSLKAKNRNINVNLFLQKNEMHILIPSTDNET